MLFINGSTMVPFKSEENLLDDVYGFIKTSKKPSNTNIEKKTESTASSEEINKDRLFGSLSKINRKIAANHADLMPNNFKVILFVISGMYIAAQVMTCNKGYVALVGTSQRYHMPESSAEVPKLLPPVLKLVYNYAMVIESTTSRLKAISSSVSLDKGPKVYFPPCFVA
ncbi:hypothetical protein CU097_008374, partial [Rhizopus azygosporus]